MGSCEARSSRSLCVQRVGGGGGGLFYYAISFAFFYYMASILHLLCVDFASCVTCLIRFFKILFQLSVWRVVQIYSCDSTTTTSTTTKICCLWFKSTTKLEPFWFWSQEHFSVKRGHRFCIQTEPTQGSFSSYISNYTLKKKGSSML